MAAAAAAAGLQPPLEPRRRWHTAGWRGRRLGARLAAGGTSTGFGRMKCCIV